MNIKSNNNNRNNNNNNESNDNNNNNNQYIDNKNKTKITKEYVEKKTYQLQQDHQK